MKAYFSLSESQTIQIIGALNNVSNQLKAAIASDSQKTDTASVESVQNYQLELKALQDLLTLFETADFN